MALMDVAWRNANIIPKYNQAGVRRFAFQVPAACRHRYAAVARWTCQLPDRLVRITS